MAARQLGQHVNNGLRAEHGKAVVQLPGRFRLADGGERLQHHRSGVKPGFHLHDRHARFLIASKDGAVDWRSTAPTRQQRRMNVQAAISAYFMRTVEHGLRQDQAVSRDHHDVGVERDKLGLRFGGFKCGRLKDRNAACQR